jgi:hypothetical protein
VVYLLQHPDVAKQIIERGRWVPAEYDIRLMVQQYETEYDRLLARCQARDGSATREPSPPRPNTSSTIERTSA